MVCQKERKRSQFLTGREVSIWGGKLGSGVSISIEHARELEDGALLKSVNMVKAAGRKMCNRCYYSYYLQ